MARIIISTTFRDFEKNENGKMQLNFLKSLSKQTMKDFVLVVTVFNEKNVKRIVRKMLGSKCYFIDDTMEGNYKFSLSKTFMNAVDYGLKTEADIILDCSSDIVLQKNFLEKVDKRCSSCCAGISHPNIFCNGTGLEYGKISRGIDARFFSLDLFRNEHIYNLLNEFPSYDYGAGIETELCCIGIKYAKKCINIFPESKVLKIENVRDGKNSARGVISSFMREGTRRNIPIVLQFMKSEHMKKDYRQLVEINKKYIPTKGRIRYWCFFIKEYWEYMMKQI